MEWIASLELAADCIKSQDGGDATQETGWRSQEYLDAWLEVRAAIASAQVTAPSPAINSEEA